uniref:lysozyme n=1 Tax=Cyprinus carpio TaxID=7962 RepID=A0A8C1IJ69_CYPCA
MEMLLFVVVGACVAEHHHQKTNRVPPSGAPSKVPPSGAPSSSKPRPTIAAKDVEHLYGVFQLSDQLACDSGMIPSHNVCNMTCSALTDDDITDDIACLKTLTNFM